MNKTFKKLAICAAVAVLPLGAWADVENKATATWLFNQFGKGETVVSTEAGSVKVLDLDGLYFAIGKDGAARNLTTESAKLDNDMKDGETVVFSKGWYTGLYSNDGRGTGYSGAANDTKAGGRLSLRINRPGKLYVLCRNYNQDRLIGVFKGNSSSATVTSEHNTGFQMLTVEITKSELQTSGTGYNDKVICHITGYYMDGTSQKGNGFKIFGVKYVVSEDAAQLSKSVTIPSCGYTTFSGPHTYTIASVSDGTASAWYASAENDNTIKLAQSSNKRIAPCEGFIINGTPGATATLKTVEEQTTVSGNLLVANLAAYQLPATTTINKGSDATYYNYILVADGESAVFKHTTGTGDLAANKAFLRTTTNVTAEGARGFSFDFGGGETTAVTEVELAGDNNSGKCYTLQGKEVRTPSKGLYIVNGKKVIIK